MPLLIAAAQKIFVTWNRRSGRKFSLWVWGKASPGAALDPALSRRLWILRQESQPLLVSLAEGVTCPLYNITLNISTEFVTEREIELPVNIQRSVVMEEAKWRNTYIPLSRQFLAQCCGQEDISFCFEGTATPYLLKFRA